ncbi:hypothetical protein ACWKWP_11080 [Agromyces soli]
MNENANEDLPVDVRPEASGAVGAFEPDEPADAIGPRQASGSTEPAEGSARIHAADAFQPDTAGESPAPAASAPPAPASAQPGHDDRPTIRWGAIAWALIFATIAGTTLWVLVSEHRRETVAVSLAVMQPAFVVLYAVLALGAVLALFGVVGLIRRGERARRAPRA